MTELKKAKNNRFNDIDHEELIAELKIMRGERK